MSDSITLSSAAINCPDSAKLAAFYADITGGEVTRRYDVQPNAEHCLVFADPAGHPFCLSTWDELQH